MFIPDWPYKLFTLNCPKIWLSSPCIAASTAVHACLISDVGIVVLPQNRASNNASWTKVYWVYKYEERTIFIYSNM